MRPILNQRTQMHPRVCTFVHISNDQVEGQRDTMRHLLKSQSKVTAERGLALQPARPHTGTTLSPPPAPHLQLSSSGIRGLHSSGCLARRLSPPQGEQVCCGTVIQGGNTTLMHLIHHSRQQERQIIKHAPCALSNPGGE